MTLATPPRYRAHDPDRPRAATPEALGEAMARLGAGSVPGPRALADLHAHITAQRDGLEALVGSVTQGGRQSVDIGSTLAATAAPVALLWGRADRVLPWQQALAAPARVALHLFADGGHAPHWQYPAACAEIVSTLVGRTQGPGA